MRFEDAFFYAVMAFNAFVIANIAYAVLWGV